MHSMGPSAVASGSGNGDSVSYSLGLGCGRELYGAGKGLPKAASWECEEGMRRVALARWMRGRATVDEGISGTVDVA